MSDEEILTYCKSADTEAVRVCVSVLARRHAPGVFNHIYRIVGDREIAEDLLQETFVRIYRKSREYRQIARFSTWLFKIATNLSLNEIRNRRHRPHLSLETPVEPGEEDARNLVSLLRSGASETPVRMVEDRDFGRLLQEAIGQLPEQYRVVLILCDVEKFSYDEAAQVLDTRPGTVGSRLARARQFLAGRILPLLRRAGK